jgi:hypothetical protein
MEEREREGARGKKGGKVRGEGRMGQRKRNRQSHIEIDKDIKNVYLTKIRKMLMPGTSACIRFRTDTAECQRQERRGGEKENQVKESTGAGWGSERSGVRIGAAKYCAITVPACGAERREKCRQQACPNAQRATAECRVGRGVGAAWSGVAQWGR